MEQLTLSEARRLKTGVVYAFADPDGPIVYVGMTRKPSNRFASYSSSRRGHNPRLSAWLAGRQELRIVRILSTDEATLLQVERQWIKALKDQLFNVVHGGEQAWRRHESMPWMASTGIHCPSSAVLVYLTNRGTQMPAGKEREVREAIARMSIRERCAYEVQLCMDLQWHMTLRHQLDRWVDKCRDKLIAAMAEPVPVH